MADESSSPAGKRFSEDLRRIREERDISIDDVHADTRIAKTLIESFEEGRLYDHPTYNRVYLRSFVKEYAKVVDISEDAALSGLEAALEGTYQNALADQYLPSFQTEVEDEEEEGHETEESGRESPSPDVPEDRTSSGDMPEPPTAGGPEGRGGIVGPPRAVGEESDAHDELGYQPDDGQDDDGDSVPSSEPVKRDEEDDSFSFDAESDEDSEETGWPPNRREEAEDTTDTDEPEVTADETDEESDGDLPSWMKKDDDDSDEESIPEPETRSPESSSPSEGAAYRDTGSSGIVGEPTELGSGKQEEVLEGAGQASMSSPDERSPRSRDRSSGWFSVGQGANQSIYVTGAGIAVVLIVLVGLGFAYFSSDNRSQDVSSASPTPDTTAAVPAEETSTTASGSGSSREPSPASITLGETIHLGVVATDNVSSIRIQRDDDLRRPYWIQEGQAEVYPFQEQATIERELSDIRLFIDGYRYPFSPEDTRGGLQITRSDLEAFVDTLSGAPTPLPATPDTLPIGTPSQEP